MNKPRLDGCYGLRTDLSGAQARKELVHDRYKDLKLVVQAFRISKMEEKFEKKCLWQSQVLVVLASLCVGRVSVS